MASHLILRGNHYYFRLRVPTDLSDKIPPKEFLKSLKTKVRKTARTSATYLYSNLLEVFALLRSGFISGSQALERLDLVMQRKQDKPRIVQPSPVENTLVHPKHTLSQVIQEYTNDKQSGWTEKTKLEYGGYFRLIKDIVGERGVSEITRDVVRTFRDTLSRLPANLYKKYSDKTIEEILLMDDITPMSPTTINKLLTLLGGVMRHCIKEGYIKDNPVEGLKIQKKKRPDEERKAYSKEDLKKIVTNLPSPADRPERFWIPLIGMFSGMRLGEICGLHIEDIKQVGGVWCFDINGQQDKRLKTVSSKRIIPVHPCLIQNGFLPLVDTLRVKGNIRLWPNLKRRETDGYCHAMGKWFQRFNRKYVTEDPLKTFHSLRHTFADTLKQQGVQEVLIAELMGHANRSTTTGRYGKAYKPKILLEVLGKLDYNGL